MFCPAPPAASRPRRLRVPCILPAVMRAAAAIWRWISRRIRDMRNALPILLCSLVLLMAVTPVRAASRTLLLEIWLDGKSQGRVTTVTLTGDQILIAADDLLALKLNLAVPKPDDAGRVDISVIHGLTATVNESEQRLELSAP